MMRIQRIARSQQIATILICFSFGVIAGCLFLVGLEYYIRPDIWSYSGDGDIDFLFISDPPLLPPGIQINFGAFDLAREFNGSYKIRNLPGSRFSIQATGLRIYTLNRHAFDRDFTRDGVVGPNAPTGELSMTIRRKDGKVVFDVRKPISQWTASTEGAARSGLREFKLFYRKDGLSTCPVWSELQPECTLEVSYIPGEKPVQGIGVVALWRGGSL